MGVRRLDAGRKVAEGCDRATGNDAVEAATLDMSDLASVSAFARAWNGPLHILVNNAGVMALPELQRSALGCAMQFASNFLGHFVLVVQIAESSRLRRRRARGVGQFDRTPVLARGVRRPTLPVPTLRSNDRLRSVEAGDRTAGR